MIRHLLCAISFALLATAAVSAQTSTYSFDNFDTQTGVKLYTPPAILQSSPVRHGKSARSKSPAAIATPASNSASIVRPTLLTFDSSVTSLSTPTSLRGFTTGDSQ